MANITFRYATKNDSELVLKFIKELAVYEKLENEVVATKELLEKWIFDKKKAEVIFAVVSGKEVGFALFSVHSQLSLADQEFILKICMFHLNTEDLAMEKQS